MFFFNLLKHWTNILSIIFISELIYSSFVTYVHISEMGKFW